jgi:hypothetical protein
VVVWIIALRQCAILTVTLWQLMSRWTRTAVTGSAWVLPVRVLVARPSRRGCKLAMGTAILLASSTLVPGVKLIPPQVAAAPTSRTAGTRTMAQTSFQRTAFGSPDSDRNCSAALRAAKNDTAWCSGNSVISP